MDCLFANMLTSFLVKLILYSNTKLLKQMYVSVMIETSIQRKLADKMWSLWRGGQLAKPQQVELELVKII
jgi:hypothetical protein